MPTEPEGPKEGVTVPKIDPFKSKTTEKIPVKKRRVGVAILLYFILVLIPLGGMSYFMYISLYKVHKLRLQLLRQNIATQSREAYLRAEFQSYQAENNKDYKKIQDIIDAQAAQIHELSDKHNWRISEAIYLVAIAQERLNMVGDSSTALKLLQTAEDHLKSVGDPRTSRAREAIAFDIKGLQDRARFDKIGLWVELGVLRKQIENLSFHSLQASIEGQPEIVGEEPKQPKQSAWKQGLDNTWHELKGLIKVREFNADKLNTALEPRDQILLLRALDLTIIEAQWAVLQEEPLVYQQSLDRLSDKLQIYFVQDDLWKQVEAQVALLKKKSVKPPQIDLTPTLKLLKSLESTSLQPKSEPVS